MHIALMNQNCDIINPKVSSESDGDDSGSSVIGAAETQRSETFSMATVSLGLSDNV